MFKKAFILAGIIIAVLAVACGGSSKSSQDAGKSATIAATSAATSAAQASPTAQAEPGAEATLAGSSDSSFNPISFMTGQMFGTDALAAEGAVEGEADPDLTTALLTESDLPSGFQAEGGDMGYTMDMPDGQMKMAIRTFSQGDTSGGELAGPVVMSAAMALPASELSKFDTELGQVDQMSTSDLEQQMGGASALGITIKDVNLSQVDIGDGGASMHMVMDMSGLAEAFGGSEDALGPFQNGIALDVYVFKHNDRILMVMSMWPADQASPIDIESLANTMNSRA